MDNESFGKEVGLMHELLITGRKAGADKDFYVKLAKNETLFRRIVNLVKDSKTSQKHAREIMGKNFFGIEEAIECFGISPTSEQLNILNSIPFSEKVLEELKNTHILVAVFPISIFEIWNKVIERYSKNPGDSCWSKEESYSDVWYYKQPFFRESGEVGWQLVSRYHFKDSMEKTWKEQQFLLADNEEVPSARILVYALVGNYMVEGFNVIRMLCQGNEKMRTSSIALNGYHVVVEFHNSSVISIFNFWGDRNWDDLRDHIGVSFARKL